MKFLLKELKKGKPYKFSMLFAWIFIIVSFPLVIGGIMYDLSGNQHYYSYCPDSYKNNCENFFYNNSNYCGSKIELNNTLCTTKILYAGQSIGEKPNTALKDMPYFVFGFMLILLIINHLLYNKDYFKEEVKNE